MSAPASPWRDLALRAIECLHDVERETSWGQPTFGPSVWERLRDEQNELLHAESEAEASSPSLSIPNAEVRNAFIAGWWVNAADPDNQGDYGPNGRAYFESCAEGDWQQYASAIDAGGGETGTGSIGKADESAVSEVETPAPDLLSKQIEGE